MMPQIILEILTSLKMENRYINGILTAIVEITEQDAADIIQLRNNPEINRFLSSQTTTTLEQQMAWIKQNRAKKDNIYFKIIDLKTKAFKGTISLYSIENDKAEFGRFIATNPIAAIESEFLLLKYGFEHLGLNEIYCCTVKENTKVWNQHTKFGFKIVGEDFDSRIQQTRVIQSLQKSDYQTFDYDNLLKTIKRFA
jgi:RimJ/RimL family protein N-acetyltransferase